MLTHKDGTKTLLASRITVLRKRLGLSMRSFARVVGVSQPTQSRIEGATRTPDADYLRNLAKHFKVDLNELLDSKPSGIETQAAELLAAWRAANDDGKRLIEQTASFVAQAARPKWC